MISTDTMISVDLIRNSLRRRDPQNCKAIISHTISVTIIAAVWLWNNFNIALGNTVNNLPAWPSKITTEFDPLSSFLNLPLASPPPRQSLCNSSYSNCSPRRVAVDSSPIARKTIDTSSFVVCACSSCNIGIIGGLSFL